MIGYPLVRVWYFLMRHTNSIVVIASIINAIQGITPERMIAQIGKLSSAGAMGSQYRWMNGWMNGWII